jgi:ubiquinone/menaquinone biosynthesis C-methylase UbiE
MHAQTQAAAEWWARPRGQTNASWVQNYRNSLRVRHRDLIVESIATMPGVTSVLEVGSHCGPNLVRLAQALPTLEQLTGVDVNADAIAAGVQWAHGLGLSERVHLDVGRVPDATSALPDGCVDVVLSCYSLAYIAPSDLDAVLYEMGRLARRAIVIAEPMTDQSNADATPASFPVHQSMTGYAEWAHNYRAASKWIGSWRGCALTVTPVSPPVDRLNGILVAARAMPSVAPTP